MPSLRLFDNSSDRAAVMALWRSVFGYEAAHNDPALAIDRKRAVDDDLFFVALDEHGAVIGTVMAGYDGHRGWLYSVAVHPQHRRHGVGRTLVQTAELALVQRGCLKINLQLLASNAASAAFYEALGYAVEPRISMGKVLAQNLPVPTG